MGPEPLLTLHNPDALEDPLVILSAVPYLSLSTVFS